MRKLGLKDAFALARIIKAAALRDVITEFARGVRNKGGGQDLESVGFEFLLTLAESISDEAIEKKIYTNP